VGALLEAKADHTGRSARNHLRALAATHGIGDKRVNEVIDMTGLQQVAKKRVGGFSLGMGQRLGIAAALLGDPAVLVLDEPLNGLDPEGIVWIRTLMKQLAGEGRTVLVSSHLMNEMAVTADHLIVIGRGRLIADCPTDEFVARGSQPAVRVSSPDARTLATVLTGQGAQVSADGVGALIVTGLDAPRIAELAAAQGLVLYELSPQRASLEDAFMQLTQDSVEFDGARR
jgi:ABC-2 type transport system ATP-binding protein